MVDEAATVDDALDREEFFVDGRRAGIGDDERGGQIAIGDIVRAQLFERTVGIARLAVGIGIDQRRLAIEHHLAQHRADRFAFGKPLPPEFGQLTRRLGLVEGDPARHPTVGETEIVEGIEQSWGGDIGEAGHRQQAQMQSAELRLERRRVNGVSASSASRYAGVCGTAIACGLSEIVPCR